MDRMRNMKTKATKKKVKAWAYLDDGGKFSFAETETPRLRFSTVKGKQIAFVVPCTITYTL